MKSNKIDYFSSPANNSLGFQQIQDPPKDQNFNQYNNPQDQFKTPKKEHQFRFSPLYHYKTDFAQNQFLDDSQSFFKDNRKDYIKTQKKSYKIGRKISFNQKEQQEQFASIQQQINQKKGIQFQKKYLQKQEEFFNKNMKSYDFYTPNKKSNKRQNFNLEFSQKSIKGCEKGLRRLSHLSFQIVNQLGSTSYKEVAQKLLQKLNITQQLYLDQERQDKSGMRNIKRRVYDSLNVLIALGALTRNGNKIVRNKPKKIILTQDDESKNNILNQYNRKQFMINYKRKIFHDLRLKIVMLRKILQRNKAIIQRQAIVQFESQKITFPFIAVANEQTQQQSNIKYQLVQTKKKKETSKTQSISSVDLQFKKNIQVFGDIDSIIHLINHQKNAKNQQMLQEGIESQVIKSSKTSQQGSKLSQKFQYFRKQSLSELSEHEEQSSKMKQQQPYQDDRKNQQKQQAEYVDPQKLIDQVFNHSFQ